MPRKLSTRVVVNRQALSAIEGVLVDGLEAVGQEIIADTRPPDAPVVGQGLVQQGDWGVWAGTRKVAGTAAKPRAARLAKGLIHLLVGYGFPARFQEIGTVHQPARPFFTPVVLRNAPEYGDKVREAFHKVDRGSR